MFFFYRRDLRNELWPVKSLLKPNTLLGEKYTKDGSSVRDQIHGKVMELSESEVVLSLDELKVLYPLGLLLK